MTTGANHVEVGRPLALFGYGFRPFFLFGALWSACAIALFFAALWTGVSIPSAFPAVVWHQHEMIFGYVPAVIAGFLLTAVPNWTRRPPVVGVPLAALFAIWLAGRIAVFFSALIGAPLAAIADLSFLAALAAVVAREIIAAGNNRNLKVLAILALLLVANAMSHLEASGTLMHGLGSRIGISAIILLICLIGGRIIPSFTRNWLAKREPGPLPVQFDRKDAVVMAITAVALAKRTLQPESRLTSLLAILAAASNAYRLQRWAGHRTGKEPLVLVLHVAFAFVPVGFALVALSGLFPAVILPSGATHGWTAGAVGMMTLAVMTRASLGHTGQPLAATRAITFIYLAVLLAALARIAMAFGLDHELLLAVAAGAWLAGFLGFAVVFAPSLTTRRP